MSKTKYYFDKDNLEFIPIKRTNLNKLFNLILFLISSIIFAGFITVLLLNTEFINTPQELVQSREIKNYELQMKVLNKKLEQVESALANIEKRDNNLYRVYFEASPIPEEQRRMGFGGVNRYDYLNGYENSDLIINTTERIDILTKELVIQSKSLDEIDAAITQVSSFRASFGAVENRIDAKINNLTTLKTNTQAAQSRIEDADFAAETTNMTKAQILSQAATSMLAQANASKQNLLALLQG